MADNNAKAIAQLSVDNKKFIAAFKESSAIMKKTLDEEARKRSEEFKKSMKGNALSVGGLVKSIGGLFAIAKVNAFVKESIKLNNIQAEAEAQLANSLGFRSEKLLAVASAQQKLTLFGDEATIAMQAQIAGFIKSEDAIAKLTPSVQDFAQKTGMDLVATGALIAKTVGSSTNALARYGIEVTGAAGSTERAASLQQALAEKFGGSAEAARKALGPLGQVGNSFGDIQEVVGGLVSNELQPFAQWFVDNTPTIITGVKAVGNTFKVVFKTMALAGNSVILALGKQFEWFLAGINAGIDLLPDALIPDGWKGGLKETENAIALFNTGVKIGIGELVEEINSAFDKPSAELPPKAKRAGAAVAAAFSDGFNEVIEFTTGDEQENVLRRFLGTRPEAELSERQKFAEAMQNAQNVGRQALMNAETERQSIIDASIQKEKDKRSEALKHLGSLTQSTFKSAFSDSLLEGENLFTSLTSRFKDLFIDQALDLLAGTLTKGLFAAFGGGAEAGGSLLGNLLGFASGTPFAAGGPALVGERGPEILNLPQGASVSNSQSNNTTNNVTVNNTINQTPGESSQDLANRIEEVNRRGYGQTGLSNFGIAGAV